MATASERLVVVRPVPYSLDRHGGVADNARSIASEVERHHGISYHVVDPRNEHNPQSHHRYHFGQVRFNLSNDGTRHEFAVASEREAGNLLNHIKPNVVHVDEPGAGWLIVPLIKASPRRKADKERIPVFGATMHARIDGDQISRNIKNFIRLYRLIPIIPTKKYFPVGFEGRYFDFLRNNMQKPIAVTQPTADFVNQRYFKSEFDIVPNAIDTKTFTPWGEKLARWQAIGKKIILQSGRLEERKGMDTGIRALPKLLALGDDPVLIIVGQGPLEEELRQLASDLGVSNRVIFENPLQGDEYPQGQRTADVFLSDAENEGFGRVGPVAIASGTPAVLSNIPGHREAVKNRNHSFAVLAENGNVDEFAQRIHMFLNRNEEQTLKSAYEGHAFIDRHYSLQHVGKMQADIYKRWDKEHGHTQTSAWPEKKRSRKKMRKKISRGVKKVEGYFKKRGTIFRG